MALVLSMRRSAHCWSRRTAPRQIENGDPARVNLSIQLSTQPLRYYQVAGPGQKRFERSIEEPANVRNRRKDEVSVAAVNAVEPDVRIVNPNVSALADEVLEEGDHGALAQVVRVLLEREPDHADPRRRDVEHGLNGATKMLRVARQHRTEHRQMKIHPSGAIVEGAQILGQTGSAEREPGLQVGAGDVQANVLAQSVHYFAGVDLELAAQRADLVGEGDFHRVERIAGVLDHFG